MCSTGRLAEYPSVRVCVCFCFLCGCGCTIDAGVAAGMWPLPVPRLCECGYGLMDNLFRVKGLAIFDVVNLVCVCKIKPKPKSAYPNQIKNLKNSQDATHVRSRSMPSAMPVHAPCACVCVSFCSRSRVLGPGLEAPCRCKEPRDARWQAGWCAGARRRSKGRWQRGGSRGFGFGSTLGFGSHWCAKGAGNVVGVGGSGSDLP